MELYKQGVKMLQDIPRHSQQPENRPSHSAFLEQFIALYIRLGAVANVTASVPFDLSVPMQDNESEGCYSLYAAQNSLTWLLAQCLVYESAVAKHVRELGTSRQNRHSLPSGAT